MTIKRESLYDILIKFGVLEKLVRLIKACLNGTQSKVRIGNWTGRPDRPGARSSEDEERESSTT